MLFPLLIDFRLNPWKLLDERPAHREMLVVTCV